MSQKVRVRIDERWHDVEVGDLDGNPISVVVDGVRVEVDTQLIVRSLGVPTPDASQTRPEPRQAKASAPSPPPKPTSVARPAQQPKLEEAAASPARTPSAIKAFRSPMPGVIVSVAVSEGDQVVTGDEVCVLEAMKMQQVLRADWTGIVKAVHVRAGQQVLDGDAIVDLQ